jgi:murein DD-endopeptidase MepM/ murein hydrolase activator NlpD
MAAAKYVTIMVIPDGTESRKGIRVRIWHLKAAVGLLAALLVGIVMFFIFYGYVLSRAALTDKLEAENQRLQRYQVKVKMLEDNLKETREIVGRLVKLAGVDFEFPQLPDDSVIFSSLDRSVSVERPVDDGRVVPWGLPIQGFISQDFEINDRKHYHPGVDVACAEGTPILATAAGTVQYADYDSVYGYMVVLRHNDSVTTIYGHAKELLVKPGDVVSAGSKVALSGNTGKSTAPHLHYEIRIHDNPINPLEYGYDKKDNH